MIEKLRLNEIINDSYNIQNDLLKFFSEVAVMNNRIRLTILPFRADEFMSRNKDFNAHVVEVDINSLEEHIEYFSSAICYKESSIQSINHDISDNLKNVILAINFTASNRKINSCYFEELVKKYNKVDAICRVYKNEIDSKPLYGKYSDLKEIIVPTDELIIEKLLVSDISENKNKYVYI